LDAWQTASSIEQQAIFMGKISDTVHAVHSVTRTLLLAALVAGAGAAGWTGYSLYNEPQRKLDEKERELDKVRDQLQTASEDLLARQRAMASLSAELKEKNEKLQRLETSMRLLKLSHRIARLRILDQTTHPESGRTLTTVEFFEVNDDGAPMDARRRQFQIEGDRVYVECLVVKFDDRYVEQADLDRSTAICLFQRIFGEYQQPQEGYQLDAIGSSPTSYARGGKMSAFEKRIWSDFWNIASDRRKAAEIGIRAAHADAPSIRVRKGAVYELELRSTGEFTLRPVQAPVTSPQEIAGKGAGG